MKIDKVRFTNCVLAFDAVQMPVTHRFFNVEQGLTIEVRNFEHQTFVYAMLDCCGSTRYAGNSSGYWSHNDADMYQHISIEMFKLADELGVESHYIWPFVEQLPVFTVEGINVAEAMALAGPIKDLLARGAPPVEVIQALHTDKETIEFVLGGALPQPRPPRRIVDVNVVNDDTNW